MAGLEYQSTRAKRVISPTAFIALVNFFAFLLISTYLGGDAINGYTAHGDFFVCGHGLCRRVTSSVWHYSYCHAIATIGLMLLTLAETAYFRWTGDIKFSSKSQHYH